MQLKHAVTLGALLFAILRVEAADTAVPPAAEDIFQEVLTSAQLLQFNHGSWWNNGYKSLDPAPYVLQNNERSYATIGLHGEELAHPTAIELVNDSLTKIEDVVFLPAGSGPEIVRTLPITSPAIRIRIAGNADTVGSGRILVKQVWGPAIEGDRPESLTVSLPLISFFAADSSKEHRTLSQVGRSVAFIQIAEPVNTNGCTGFLVRANVLATAAHCLRVARAAETGLDWRSTICRRIGITFDFRSGAREKDAGWSTHCSKLVYLDEKESPNPATGGQFAGKDLTDIALMTVDLAKDDGIGAGKRLPLALGSAGDAKLFSVIQHPQGDPQRVARDCVTQSGQQGSPLFLHRCATAPGSSGAPVVFYDGEGWRLFGMHTCCAHQMAVSAESPGDLHDSLQVVNFGINVDALEKAFGTTHIGRQ